MKNLLLLIVVMFGISTAGFGQGIASGSNSFSSYYICSDGIPKSSGWNFYGQLGDGTTIDKYSPVAVSGLSGITEISAGWGFAIFLKNNGTVWAAGSNLNGQLGFTPTEDFTPSPVQVSGLSGITAIAAGSDHSLFLKNDGTVWACGRNTEGQLGIGNIISTGTPVQVIGLTGITKIAAGVFHSIFLKNDGTVWTCGWNTFGQLGDGSITNRNTPVQATGLTGVTDIAGGNIHTLFLKNDGNVWACGNNTEAQYGNGSHGSSFTPIQINTLSDIISIKAGYYHSIFLKSDGTALGSGRNIEGQLGSGNANVGLTPLPVAGLSDIAEIAAGRFHSVFLKDDGSVYATGYNSNGQVGDGTVTTRISPVLVIDAGECQPAGIEEVNRHFSSLTVYPNPAKNTVVIDSETYGPKSVIKLFDATGRQVLQSPLGYSANDQSILDVSSLRPGMYFIHLLDGENQGRGKFVKE